MKKLILTLLLCVIGFSSFSFSIQENDDNPLWHCLQSEAVFLPTYENHLTASEALLQLRSFKPWKDIQIKYNEKDLWASFSVENNTRDVQQIYLNGQLTDFINLFKMEGGKVEKVSHTGYLIPFENRQIKEWGTIVSARIPANSTVHFLICFKSVTKSSSQLLSYLTIPCMKVYSARGFQETYKLPLKILYIFLGAICMMAVYNIVTSFTTRFREYLLFSVYNIIAAVVGFTLSNQHIALGWVDNLEYERNFRFIPTILLPASYLLFSTYFLELKKRIPIIYKTCLAVMIAYLIPLAAVLLSFFKFAFFIYGTLSLITVFLPFYAAMKVLKSHQSARFFILGNIAVIFMPLLQIASITGLLDARELVICTIAALLLEIVVFSFAVAHRLNEAHKNFVKMKYENELHKKDLEKTKIERKELELKIERKTRELATTSVQWINLSDRLNNLEQKILSSNIKESSENTKSILKEIKNIKNFKEEWQSFKLLFEEVHPTFFDMLERTYPELTQNDLKLCAFMKMKFSNNEIAIILNVTKKAVEQAKRRMRKKMNLPAEKDIIKHIDEIVQPEESLQSSEV